MVLALARLAIMRSCSGLIEWSAVDIMYQVGFDFQAAVLTGVVNESSENKTCDTAMNAVFDSGTSAAKIGMEGCRVNVEVAIGGRFDALSGWGHGFPDGG